MAAVVRLYPPSYGCCHGMRGMGWAGVRIYHSMSSLRGDRSQAVWPDDHAPGLNRLNYPNMT